MASSTHYPQESSSGLAENQLNCHAALEDVSLSLFFITFQGLSLPPNFTHKCPLQWAGGG